MTLQLTGSLIAAGLILGSAFAQAPRGEGPPMNLVVVGQALIDHDLRKVAPGSVERIKPLLTGDVVFTNLETAIWSRTTPPALADEQFGHYAPPGALDTLSEMGFNLLSTANNHTFDAGLAGLETTWAETAARRLPQAGSGRTLAEAGAPAFLQTPGGRVALVAMAAGALKPGAAATTKTPGVNELRLDANGVPHTDDVQRIVASVRRARKEADVVVAYIHNHYWDDERQVTPEWLKRWAHRLVDEGASMFLAHGVWLVHGIEIYKETPILYGLGNFIFQSRSFHYPPQAWESVIVQAQYRDSKLSQLTIRPIVMNDRGDDGPLFIATRGIPRPATGARASAILDRLAKLSSEFGTTFERQAQTLSLSLERKE